MKLGHVILFDALYKSILLLNIIDISCRKSEKIPNCKLQEKQWYKDSMEESIY